LIFAALAASRRIRGRGVSLNLLYRGDAAAGGILSTKHNPVPARSLEGHAAQGKEFKGWSCRCGWMRY